MLEFKKETKRDTKIIDTELLLNRSQTPVPRFPFPVTSY